MQAGGKKTKGKLDLLLLPTDVVGHCLWFLPWKERLRLHLVCKQMRRLSKDAPFCVKTLRIGNVEPNEWHLIQMFRRSLEHIDMITHVDPRVAVMRFPRLRSVRIHGNPAYFSVQFLETNGAQLKKLALSESGWSGRHYEYDVFHAVSQLKGLRELDLSCEGEEDCGLMRVFERRLNFEHTPTLKLWLNAFHLKHIKQLIHPKLVSLDITIHNPSDYEDDFEEESERVFPDYFAGLAEFQLPNLKHLRCELSEVCTLLKTDAIRMKRVEISDAFWWQLAKATERCPFGTVALEFKSKWRWEEPGMEVLERQFEEALRGTHLEALEFAFENNAVGQLQLAFLCRFLLGDERMLPPVRVRMRQPNPIDFSFGIAKECHGFADETQTAIASGKITLLA